LRTLKTPLELRPLHDESDAHVRGDVRSGVLAYPLTRINDDRLELAGLDIGAQAAPTELTCIQRIPLQDAGLTFTKTTTPDTQHRQLLSAIGASVPPQHAMLWQISIRGRPLQTRTMCKTVQLGPGRPGPEE